MTWGAVELVWDLGQQTIVKEEPLTELQGETANKVYENGSKTTWQFTTNYNSQKSVMEKLDDFWGTFQNISPKPWSLKKLFNKEAVSVYIWSKKLFYDINSKMLLYTEKFPLPLLNWLCFCSVCFTIVPWQLSFFSDSWKKKSVVIY